MHRLALFISGTGGNALNLLDHCRQGHIPAQSVVAISSSSKALGVERLRRAGLPVELALRSAFTDDLSFSEHCYHLATQHGATCICLCGWLKKLVVTAPWTDRILNIHPGLLPRWGGPGMYGMHVHRAVLAANVPESGCTIHVVDNEYDHGRILAESRVPVLPDDTPETLQQRVYGEEMRLYPLTVRDYLLSQ